MYIYALLALQKGRPFGQSTKLPESPAHCKVPLLVILPILAPCHSVVQPE